MFHPHVYLNTLCQWAGHKAKDTALFPDGPSAKESLHHHRSLRLIKALLIKRPIHHPVDIGGHYHSKMLPILQELRNGRVVSLSKLWTYREAEAWLMTEDRSYLDTPDLVTDIQLGGAGVSRHAIPTFGVNGTNTSPRHTRVLQYFFDYFGVRRTLAFSQRGILKRLVQEVAATRETDLDGLFQTENFQLSIKVMVVNYLLASTPMLYSPDILVDIVLDEYFTPLPLTQREVLLQALHSTTLRNCHDVDA